jgi:hypothetical protein
MRADLGMSNRSFARWWESYKILRRLRIMGMITPEQEQQAMALAGSSGKKTAIAKFAYAVAVLDDEARTTYPDRYRVLMALLEVC